MIVRRRLKSVLSDGFWLYLFPAAAIFMPWSWYFALCKRMATLRHPYRTAIARELDYARTLLPDIDADRFQTEQALVKFIDAADFYLNLARTHRWFRRHVRVEGHWPDPGRALLLLGSHWGAGHWIWRDLNRHGIAAWFLARRGEAADFGRGRLARWYSDFRGWGLRRAGCAGIVTTGGALGKIQALFAQGRTIVVLNDAPASTGHSTQEVVLLDRRAHLPTGAIDLALRNHASIGIFSMAFDPETGARTLRITGIDEPRSNPAAILNRYVFELSALIKARPGSWQTWTLAPILFSSTGNGS